MGRLRLPGKGSQGISHGVSALGAGDEVPHDRSGVETLVGFVNKGINSELQCNSPGPGSGLQRSDFKMIVHYEKNILSIVDSHDYEKKKNTWKISHFHDVGKGWSSPGIGEESICL